MPTAAAFIPAPLDVQDSGLEKPVFAPHLPLTLRPEGPDRFSVPPMPEILLEGDYPNPTLWPTPSPPSPVPVDSAPPVARFTTVIPAAAIPPAVIPGVAVPPAAIESPESSVDSGREAEEEPTSPRPVESTPGWVAVWLDARDPFSLFAHWDADERTLQALWAGRPGESLRLRVYAQTHDGALMADQVIAPAVHQRLVPVLYSNTPYWAELGWVGADGVWKSLAVSEPLSTPPDSHSQDWSRQRGRFVSGTAARRLVPTAEDFPPPRPTPASRKEADRERRAETRPVAEPEELEETANAEQLTALVWEPTPVVVSAGNSATVNQWVAHVVTTARVVSPGIPPSPSSPEQALLPGPTAEMEQPPASPAIPPAPSPSDFWFKINAELILYGSTEPDATVTIAGRPVKLRDDGSFTFRFSLPDGEFALPAQAVKADGSDQRGASLTFRRTTCWSGEVGAHPQDPQLLPPVEEAIR